MLEKFPANKRALEGLKSLNSSKPGQPPQAAGTGPTHEQINGLIGLYEQGRLPEALAQGTALARRYRIEAGEV